MKTRSVRFRSAVRFVNRVPVTRDPDRIDALLVALRMIWTKYPDQRLGQLIYNIMRDGETSYDPFFYEDDMLLKRMLAILDEDDDKIF
jgi:hypothetical protein